MIDWMMMIFGMRFRFFLQSNKNLIMINDNGHGYLFTCDGLQSLQYASFVEKIIVSITRIILESVIFLIHWLDGVNYVCMICNQRAL